MSYEYSEDKLVQETTATYFAEALGWESVLAYNDEVLGPNGTLGRRNQTEVVLTRTLRQKLEEFNPGLPDEAYAQAHQNHHRHQHGQNHAPTQPGKIRPLPRRRAGHLPRAKSGRATGG